MTATGGKTINTTQLLGELNAAGVMANSLALGDDVLATHDLAGQLVDFASADQAAVDAAIAAHVAMRDKTDAEYATEFQDAGTTPERKQEIRDITAGLLPRDQVPM